MHPAEIRSEHFVQATHASEFAARLELREI
jgi:hypothetical protein